MPYKYINIVFLLIKLNYKEWDKENSVNGASDNDLCTTPEANMSVSVVAHLTLGVVNHRSSYRRTSHLNTIVLTVKKRFQNIFLENKRFKTCAFLYFLSVFITNKLKCSGMSISKTT